MLLNAKGDLAAAEPLLREAAEGLYEVLGARHPSTLTSMYNFARLLKAKGDLEGALPLFAEELEGLRLLHGAAHEETRDSASNLVRVLREAGKPSAADEVKARFGV